MSDVNVRPEKPNDASRYADLVGLQVRGGKGMRSVIAISKGSSNDAPRGLAGLAPKQGGVGGGGHDAGRAGDAGRRLERLRGARRRLRRQLVRGHRDEACAETRRVSRELPRVGASEKVFPRNVKATQRTARSRGVGREVLGRPLVLAEGLCCAGVDIIHKAKSFKRTEK